mgnify:CR=1 FL=1
MTNKITPEKYFEELSSLILEFTHNYRINIVNEITKENSYMVEPERFFYVIIHKTVCSLEASNIFIRNFDSRRDYHIPLFIILRTMLSDILTAEHITHCAVTEKDCNELIEEIYFDHLDNVIRTCNTSFRHIYQWSETETQHNINLIKSNSRFYDLDGKAKRKSKSKSLTKLIVDIFSSVENKESVTHHRRAFDLYGMYSKIEHLGELSFHLIHRGYDDDKQKTLWFDLYDTIIFIIGALMSYKNLWKELQYDTIYFENLFRKIELMHPDKIANQ